VSLPIDHVMHLKQVDVAGVEQFKRSGNLCLARFFALAEKMVGELVRVTKPGGKIGVIVRSVDMPWLVNLPVSASIKQKVEAPGVMGGERAEEGCADASLYTRFHRSGLSQIKMFPQFASFNGGQNFERWKTEALSVLTDDEAEEWHAALAQAEAGGTFFIGQPLHCVVGTKP